MLSVTLSPSRIKTAQSCELKYYYNYIMKIQSESNDGSEKGDLVHRILECLSSPKRRKQVETMIRDMKLSDAVVRMVSYILSTKKMSASDSSVDEVVQLILAAISSDFFGDQDARGVPVKTLIEMPFDFETGSYKIKGFIDKAFIYSDGSARIVDYKTSKDVFKGKELTSNLQDMIYKLALSRAENIPVSKISTEFIFVRFWGQDKLKQQTLPTSEAKMAGFEHLLASFQEAMESYVFLDESDFLDGNAFDRGLPNDGSFGGSLACGKLVRTDKNGKPKLDKSEKFDENVYRCPFRTPKTIYAEKDADGKVIRRVLVKPENSTNSFDEENFLGCLKHRVTDKIFVLANSSKLKEETVNLYTK